MVAKKRRICALLLAFVMVFTMAVPAFAMGDLSDVDAGIFGNRSDMQVLSSDSYPVGKADDGGGPKMERIFSYLSGYRGPITITVEGYDEGNYRTSILVYSPDGLILREENWLPNGNRKIVNATGSERIQTIYLGIYPKPAMLFRPPWKTFTVNVAW